MTTKIFEDYVTQLDREFSAKKVKTFHFIDQCAAHLKKTFSASSKFYFSRLIVSASYCLHIWDSSSHLNAITESSAFRRL
jgi:hypothetical protein